MNIPQTFYILKDNCPEELRGIFDYYEDYWIKTVDLSLWNMHGILRRTNNNGRLNRAVGKSHANIYEFILTLIKEQGATETLLAQIAVGNIRGTSKSTKYNQINKRIDYLTRDYNLGVRNVDEFLTGIAYNISQPTSKTL